MELAVRLQKCDATWLHGYMATELPEYPYYFRQTTYHFPPSAIIDLRCVLFPRPMT